MVSVFGGDLSIEKTEIPGLLKLGLPVHGDARGWFKENWQREKMTRLGLPDFGPVQNNVSYNTAVGTVRGIHAEPWDKLVSVVSGRIFGAWVDLREGPTFGAVVTAEVDSSSAIYVPRGVGNAFQTLETGTVYSYLVNDHWSAAKQDEYTFLNLADETVDIDWPIPLAESEMSEKDRTHPRLERVVPMRPRRVLVLGGAGQLGRALARALPDAHVTSRSELDIEDAESVAGWPWGGYGTIINAAAYTKVDDAEQPAGRAAAWSANVTAVQRLASIAVRNRSTLVHVSSDYVFDGSRSPHTEDEPVAPLGVYGQTKAAGDAIVATVPRHYILRTSWVIGDGSNFVRTMADLADRQIEPTVVDDQFGRLTFADDLSAAIAHLLETNAPFGVYNASNDGPIMTWADIAQRVYALTGHDPRAVTGIDSETYFAGRSAAPRPAHSAFDLTKIKATGFVPRDAEAALRSYLSLG